VVKLDAGGRVVYSTVLGGNRYASGRGIAVDGQGRASYVAGATNATVTDASRFPHVSAPQKRLAGGGDAFPLAVDAHRVHFSTYLGRAQDDVGRAVAVTRDGSAG
jgi:hypothetical protein